LHFVCPHESALTKEDSHRGNLSNEFQKVRDEPRSLHSHSADFVFEEFGQQKQPIFLGIIGGCRRVWKVVGPSKLKMARSTADGFDQVCPLV
jgi:hypothetical protein